MLETLQRLTQEANAAQDLDDLLQIIVGGVQSVLSVEVASIYLSDFEQEQLVMMITRGMELRIPGAVRLNMGEGLVGLIAQRAEPVNLAEAKNHKQFVRVAELNEEAYHSFLGVPIIQQRKVLGVLVVQRKRVCRFDDEQVAFLVTLAGQLAGSIAHAEALMSVSESRSLNRPAHERYLLGVPGSQGIGIGTALVLYSPMRLQSIPDRQCKNINEEIDRLKQAVTIVQKEMHSLKDRMRQLLPKEDYALFDAYLLMLNSDTLINGAIREIRDGNWAEGAVRRVVLKQIRRFEEMGDSYLRERAEDMREIGRRLLMTLQEKADPLDQVTDGAVILGEEISAAQLAQLSPIKLGGIVSVRGSQSSHAAILARAMGIPAVMGVADLELSRADGCKIIADGYQGRIYVEPSSVVQQEYDRLLDEQLELNQELHALRDLDAETVDGARVSLYVNTGLLADIGPSVESGAEGIGLYRTEVPFMARDHFPGEEEQTRIYRHVLESFHPRPVTLRTLDIGGDKSLPYFPIHEENPFLGWRGIRITLDHPEIFLTQIRAAMRANSGLGNLRVMLPMITELDEVQAALNLIDQAFEELDEEDDDITWPDIGVMIEVPSAVYQVEQIVTRVDFLSIGTNDLTQYMLAVDRNNPRVAKLYDSLHPSVLQAIMQVVNAGRLYNRPVSICGEMAGDPAAVVLLLGMGIDSLSMSTTQLPQVKWVIRSFTRRHAKELLTRALSMENARSIRDELNQALIEAGLGRLIRVGN
ncbi:MAG TPA: phosphoenolpyruvate--protein phosphotransferase [Gammaproteobacteria bacterium]|nr:phosphoenolpyruvate--protein phosphotransferase [Gammaproteobacteria bacterium]